MGQVIRSAFVDASPLMWRRMWLYALIAAVLGMLAALGIAIPPLWLRDWAIPFGAKDIAEAFVCFFVTAEVLRTSQPEFRMKPIHVLAIIGLSLAAVLLFALGLVLLVIPGVLLAVKLSPLIWAYLCKEEDGPFTASWNLTDGKFWETALIVVVGFALSYAISVIDDRLLLLPKGVSVSCVFLLNTLAFYVQSLLGFRWYLNLKTEAAFRAPRNRSEDFTDRPLPAVRLF